MSKQTKSNELKVGDLVYNGCYLHHPEKVGRVTKIDAHNVTIKLLMTGKDTVVHRSYLFTTERLMKNAVECLEKAKTDLQKREDTMAQAYNAEAKRLKKKPSTKGKAPKVTKLKLGKKGAK